ncbi:MAG: outer membrane protein assembly factor BamB family protein [Planctomycetota bacterium]|jgi:sugar lactone lactonase YvrE
MMKGFPFVQLVVALAAAMTAAEVRGQHIYYADGFGAGSVIKRADLNGDNEVTLIGSGLNSADGIAVDLEGGRMYWVQQSGQLRRAGLDGGAVETLLVTGGTPHSVELDLINQKVYWTETTGNRIRRANLDGSGAELVLNGSGTDGLTLDAAHGKVYWTQGNQIRRANLNGTDNELLYTRSGPHGLALDVAAGQLYWTDLSTGRVERADLNGGGSVAMLVTGQATPVEIDLDLTEGKMYWTELAGDRVRRANLDGTDVEVIVSGTLSGPFGITAVLPGPTVPAVSQWGMAVMTLLAASVGTLFFFRQPKPVVN